LAASPFMVDESILPDMGKDALGIKSCLSWAPGLETPENTAFQKEYTRFNGRNADIFAVLGYETARMLTGTVTDSPMNIPHAVRTSGFDGPRGRFSMNAQPGYADAPLYLREVCTVGDGTGNQVLEKLPSISSWKKLKDRSFNGVNTGWTNAYLCV
jgi:branched-chain amino acid transport system substrate-binding protein